MNSSFPQRNGYRPEVPSRISVTPVSNALGQGQFPTEPKGYGEQVTVSFTIGFIILGLLLHSGFSNTSIKLIIMGAILFFTSPISGHAVAISAKQNNLKPVLNKSPIESSENKDG